MVQRADIVDEARTWVGTPYQHQGRSRHGIDCVGLLIAIAHNLDLSNYDIDGYSRNPSGMMMRRIMKRHLTEIRLSEAEQGDILHMRFDQQPQHIAILSARNTIIHSDALVGRVVEHVMNPTWRSRIRGVYRVID